MENEYLCHHGVKGMKWGIRRTPEQLGHKKTAVPNAKHLPDYTGPMYFISTNNMDGQTLEPRVAKNFFTEHGYEDNTTKRVSFAPSVNQCLMGLSQDVSGKQFYVYEPKSRASIDIYKPNAKAVPDSVLTDELWVTTPVELKRVGVIKCTGDTGEDGKQFTYGSHTAELYDWNFEWQSPSEKLQHMDLPDRITDDSLSARGQRFTYMILFN